MIDSHLSSFYTCAFCPGNRSSPLPSIGFVPDRMFNPLAGPGLLPADIAPFAIAERHSESREMQKSMRFSSKLLEDNLLNAKVQFISGYIDTFY
ncbi:hypothetical protein NYE76_30165 [Paenibacillus sp. FSL M7-0831]|uniref:hypothetical protein n=1 Tax=Paenibacillus macerans TaxID=44252 RepID=UPI001D1312A6|nr:hypothetical protein [Paenibacillus macerans]